MIYLCDILSISGGKSIVIAKTAMTLLTGIWRNCGLMQHHQESSGPGFDISNLHVRSGDK